MITFPNAKINIGLYITGKRPDGYHNIESIFYPVPLYDALEIVAADELKFTTSGLLIPGDEAGNLCLKAFHLMAENHSAIEPVHIHLQKNIPMGAGLGGGSADGAFMINLLNDFFNLKLEVALREEYAAQLGSDCPFFIENNPKLVTGRGEVMVPHNLNLAGWWGAIVSPEIHISTQEAYSSIQPAHSDVKWENITAESIAEWSTFLHNQFEKGISEKYPEIDQVKSELLKQGAVYASMTGSGSSVYGLFREKPMMDDFRTSVFKL